MPVHVIKRIREEGRNPGSFKYIRQLAKEVGKKSGKASRKGHESPDDDDV